MNRLSLAAAAALTLFAAPAFAAVQDASSPAPAITAQPAPSPEEAAFAVRGEAFNAEAQRMGAELEAIMEDANLDAATKKTRTDAILNQYEPKFAAFADEYGAFLRQMAEKPGNAEKKTEILAAADAASAQLRGMPAQIRTAIEGALAAPPAPPAVN
ncbi:translation initiation factor IF-2 [Brevundimonas diminuta]|uniref:translation initiation factor IF-2 n=1 Tax=Brevundimonas diminuta TaxID=293 RepID=UPI0022AF0C6D|nr:translation initiation factor IF-2 [Brevundimonas diminuta]MCZ4106597.1 translation initiation factor IF-2 [Brevundimonas diminuta]